MKKQLKKWFFRLGVTALFIFLLLLAIVLNPSLSYANQTTHENYTIYHQQALDPQLLNRLDEATALVQKSEFYRSSLQLDICLNDGSAYPSLVKKLYGRAFAWGFYDKVVLQGKANYRDNYTELDGYRWNLTQLLAHEMIHCIQFDKLGLLHSKPLAVIDNWKWEGYAEYIARKTSDQQDLTGKIARLKKMETPGIEEWSITLADNTIIPTEYYRYWILVQYCMDIRKMNYQQLLTDKTTEETITREMNAWFTRQQ